MSAASLRKEIDTPCCSVRAVTSKTDDWIQAYILAVGALASKHGGTYLARTASHGQLEGSDATAGLRVIIEWPSRDSTHAFMSDPDDAQHLKACQTIAENLHFVIDGQDDLA